MGQIVDFEKPKKQDLRCSFCNAFEKDVLKLFSNNDNICICDKCVIKAKQRLIESENE